MTLTTDEMVTFVSYPAPGGASDFHRIADQLAIDHPRPFKGQFGRWAIKFTGTHYEFTWICA